MGSQPPQKEREREREREKSSMQIEVGWRIQELEITHLTPQFTNGIWKPLLVATTSLLVEGHYNFQSQTPKKLR